MENKDKAILMLGLLVIGLVSFFLSPYMITSTGKSSQNCPSSIVCAGVGTEKVMYATSTSSEKMSMIVNSNLPLIIQGGSIAAILIGAVGVAFFWKRHINETRM